MASFMRLEKKLSFDIKSVRDLFAGIDRWAKDNALKLDEVKEEQGVLNGDKIDYKVVKVYKKAFDDFAHKYELTIKVTAKKEDKLKLSASLDVIATLSDSEKDNPRFSGMKMFLRNFIDVFLKEKDYRKVKEFKKTFENLDQYLKF